jgi:hypothetical protein
VFVNELVWRFDGDKKAAAEFAGIARMTIYRIETQVTVQRGTAAKIITALHEKRKLDRKEKKTSPDFLRGVIAQAKRDEQLMDLTGY